MIKGRIYLSDSDCDRPSAAVLAYQRVVLSSASAFVTPTGDIRPDTRQTTLLAWQTHAPSSPKNPEMVCGRSRTVFPMSGERRSQPLQREEEGGGSTPRKLARVLSDEAGIVTMAAPSPLMLGLGLGLGRGVGASKPVFTFMQLQELEHQALIYKYMAAGLPVPVQLVLPIWKSVAASSFDHYSYPSCLMGYGACAWTIGTSWCRCQGGAGGPTAKSGGAPETSSPTRSTASATCTGAATVQESPWKRELPPPSPPLPPSSVAAACLRQDSACRTLASFKTTPLLDLPVGEGRHRRHEASPQLVGSGG
ncbi:QLQ [Musa troglodytarum]|uniref:Growth-regulating factor n=1 Tax=Musa troglodytarum TaxID=320322 RepID=A0A9E7H5C5_9LILI|nr:QLQ [Musa troglodytarum]